MRADKADVHVPGRIRADRSRLRSPRPRADGSVIYDAYLAFADRAMRYPWGTEVATEQALSDPEYLEALRGLSLVTTRDTVHANGVPVSVRADAVAVGSILDARWDAGERAVVLELVVNDRQTLADIESGKTTDLSEAYTPVTAVRADGVIEQRKRRPNHVAIVESGRMPGAGLRADEDDMDEEIKALVAKAIREELRADEAAKLERDLKAAEQRADAAEQRADKAEQALKGLRDRIGINADTDDIDAALAAVVVEKVRADSALLEEARELGVELPEDSTPATRERDLAVALGAERQRADSADFDARSFIDGRKAAPVKRTAAERHRADARTTPTGGAQRRLS